ncbi:MAG TPA: SlyX family protein [Verrucomicrobiae bacterium]|nr:SlyX family protein [Verrucomicrobiae bacterium]
MDEAIAARFERLESNLAHVEHLAEQLNQIITEQGRQLDYLKKLTQRQAATLENMELERIKSTNPKPPHY